MPDTPKPPKKKSPAVRSLEREQKHQHEATAEEELEEGLEGQFPGERPCLRHVDDDPRRPEEEAEVAAPGSLPT